MPHNAPQNLHLTADKKIYPPGSEGGLTNVRGGRMLTAISMISVQPGAEQEPQQAGSRQDHLGSSDTTKLSLRLRHQNVQRKIRASG